MTLNKEDSSVRDSPTVYLDQVNSSFDTHQYLSKQNYSIHSTQFTFFCFTVKDEIIHEDFCKHSWEKSLRSIRQKLKFDFKKNAKDNKIPT